MVENRPSLLELQRWMRWVLTEPRGVAAALAQPDGEPEPNCLGWIESSPELGAEARLDIYAEGYFTRLASALAEQFPALADILGETEFYRLAAHYLVAHPSRSPNIAEAGRELPAFLACGKQERPVLGDLAKLEWSVLEALHADDLPLLDAGRLQALTPAAWAGLRVGLDSSLRLLASDWPIDTLRETRQLPEPLESAPIRLMVFRQLGVVQVERLSEAAYLTLEQMAQGLPLQAIFETLASQLELNAPLPPVQAWFGDWVGKGLIRELFSR